MISDEGKRPVIVAGNHRQAMDFLREQLWAERDCIVVDTPHRLRGVRGPIEVHRVGTYRQDRSSAFIEEVEQSIRLIETTALTGGSTPQPDSALADSAPQG